MKTNREMRAEAWRLLWREGWFGRLTAAGTVLLVFAGLVAGAVTWGFRALEIGTLADHLKTAGEMSAEGLAYLPPSSGATLRLLGASLFQGFVQHLLSGLVVFGLTALALRAARGERAGWLTAGLSGFAAPFTMFWQMFSVQIRLMFWTFAALVPAGVVAGLVPGMVLGAFVLGLAMLTVLTWAVYRYRAVWFLRVEHPDWSAGQCVRGSIGLMNGWKWRAVQFDCSYAVWLLGLLPLSSALLWAAVRVRTEGGFAGFSQGELLGLGLLLSGGLLYCLVTGLYITLGHAVFYREMKAELPQDGGDDPCQGGAKRV